MTEPAHGAGGTPGDVSAVDGAALLAAGKTAPEIEAAIRAGSKVFGPPTDKAAAALGRGWLTAQAMTQVTDQWHQAVTRLADEIDYLGSAVEKSARNHTWAEEETERRVARIRTGGR